MKLLEIMDFIFGEDGIKSLRISILNMFLDNCNPGYPVYVADIPSFYCNNARNSYAPFEPFSNILAIADDTVFGTFKRGLMFTNEGVYYKGMLQSPEYSEYGTLEIFDDMYSSTYNTVEVSRLFNWLNNLELLSNVYAGIKIAIDILDMPEDELEEMIEQYLDEILIPAMEESAQLMNQKISNDFVEFILETIKTISNFFRDW